MDFQRFVIRIIQALLVLATVLPLRVVYEVDADSEKPLQCPDSPAPGPSLDDKGFNGHLSKAEQSAENLSGEDGEVEIIEDEEHGYTTQAGGDPSQSVADPKSLTKTAHGILRCTLRTSQL
ncbi:hypothetical protein K503DRAFT_806282 [Rhizopogon vinicolor AM-OR11-026]|uniref:Uncharacterized protein n=1 Tax=Rhizopogon vinicolor AM-OR11-026 TaxID=1314800 RepID=A0A1B7MF13_9AGAM|nr:hypothetical protein K503DRAFT_806282 [Rhizopogon vinicolor AM-OR11-026]